MCTWRINFKSIPSEPALDIKTTFTLWPSLLSSPVNPLTSKSLFGDKYGSYIPNDVIRYIRKSPAQLFKRLYDMYGDKAYEYLDKAKSRTNK